MTVSDQRRKQIAKYRGCKCCVCGKWGGREADGLELASRTVARGRGLTLRAPLDDGIHDKCSRQLRVMLDRIDQGARKLTDLARLPLL